MKTMKYLMLPLFLLASGAAPAFADPSPLVGTWILEHSEDPTPEGKLVPYCTGAHGMIIYTAEGYVSVALNCAPAVSGAAPEPADVSGRKFFYAGTYRFDGTNVSHQVMNSSELGLIGESVSRAVTIQGNELILTGVSLGQQFSAYWKRVN